MAAFNKFKLFILLALLVVGCNDSFEPLAENDHYFFSMYGYLDASADTQWVRVAPAREQLVMDQVMPEVQVTLEDMKTGDLTVMNDSLMQLRNGVNILNFWTTEDIKLGHSYRLKAERPGGASSSAIVTTPELAPTLRLEYLVDSLRVRVVVNRVERLADVQTVWKVRVQSGVTLRKRKIRYPHRNRALNGNGLLINIGQECDQLVLPEGRVEIAGIEVLAAAGGPEWIEDIATINDLEYALPEGFSNVLNGVGYVVGIASTTILYEKMINYQNCNQDGNL